MSETESKPVPPVDQLIAEEHGLTAWRPQYDGIEISLAWRCVKLRLYRGEQELTFNLTPEQARHVAACLVARADRLDPLKEGK